jgi:hypothetical protein
MPCHQALATRHTRRWNHSESLHISPVSENSGERCAAAVTTASENHVRTLADRLILKPWPVSL